MVRFAPEHVVLFLGLWNLGSKGRHKATTRNGVPWELKKGDIVPRLDTKIEKNC